MVSTYLIYLTLLIYTPLLIKYIVGKRTKVSIRQWSFILMVLLVLSFIIGGRYEVGTDFPNYVDYYKSFLDGSLTFSSIGIISTGLEPGYLFINWLGSKIGLSVSTFFTILSLVSFILMLKAQNENAYLWPLFLFFFFGQMFPVSLNIVRQSCAIFIFFYALQFISRSKLKLFILITICVLFHYSSVVFYVVLLIDSKWLNFLDNRKLVLILFLISWFLASLFLPLLLNILPLDILGDKYLRNLANVDIEMQVNSGLGILMTKITDILLILQSDNIKKYYRNQELNNLYRVFYVGIIMTNIMGISMFLSRVFLGMVMLRIYILAYTTYYSLKSKQKNLLLGIFLILLCFLQLVLSIKNGNSGISPYQFMWQ